MFLSYLSHGAPKLDVNADKLLYPHDPAIAGYFGVYFEGIRNLDSRIFGEELNSYALRTNSDIRNPKLIEDSLTAYCISAEIPDLSIRVLDVKTVQYFSIGIPSVLEYSGQTTTFRFYDTSTGILIRFFRNWFYVLRRPDKFTPKRRVANTHNGFLKCNAILFATDPSLSEITFACGFLGLMPTNLPLSNFNMDVQSRTFTVINQTFRFDRIVFDDHIYNYAYNTLLPMFMNHDGVIQWQLD